jgi:hypothetical protein
MPLDAITLRSGVHSMALRYTSAMVDRKLCDTCQVFWNGSALATVHREEGVPAEWQYCAERLKVFAGDMLGCNAVTDPKYIIAALASDIFDVADDPPDVDPASDDWELDLGEVPWTASTWLQSIAQGVPLINRT